MTSDEKLVAGRYRLGARIGSGAMGVVWQAHDERLHRTVAVKQLLSQPGLSSAQAEEARQRAMREGRIAARLSHPNAVTVYDVAEHDGEPWLIMEYLPSQSLAAVLNEREFLQPEEAARIGSQIAAALVAAHAAGIVHRDVKPANVLLGDNGTVKITDFGISRATGDVTVTATGMLAGTPAYLAPEVAKGEQPTSAADVFSLGSTLYTAVEGHSPFGLSENTLALLYAVAAGKVVPPRQAGSLTALLMQLLRADPTERPTMTAAKDALAAVAAGKPLPSVAMGVQRTDPYPKPPQQQHNPQQHPQRPQSQPMMAMAPQTHQPQTHQPMNQPPMTPPGGHPGTRLDVNPFAEPTPSGPRPAMHPDQGNRQRQQPARPGGASRPPGGGNARQPQRRPAANQPPKKGRDTRSIVLTVLAIVAAALVGILVASLLTNTKSGADARNSGPATSTTRPHAAQAKVTTAASTPTSTTETTTTTSAAEPAKPSPADYEKTVRSYFALLPARPDAAWDLLTDNARGKSKSAQEYRDFYGKLAAVQVLDTKPQGDKVAATVRFTTKDHKTATETMVFTFAVRGDLILIDDFTQTGKREKKNDHGG